MFKRKVIGIMIAFSIFLSICFVYQFSISVKAADPESITVWVSTDRHYGGAGGLTCWEDALDDVKNWDWAFSIGLGDISSDWNMYADYRDIIISKFIGTSHIREDIYDIDGNADAYSGESAWLTYIDPAGLNPVTSLINNSLRPYQTYNWSEGNLSYVIKMGNVIWLMYEEEFAGGTSMEWVNETVEYWSNHTTDYNIVWCTHTPFKPYAGWDQSWCVSSKITAYLRATSSWNDVRTYLHGHRHWTGESRVYNDVEADLDCFVLSAIDTVHYGSESHSYFLTFEVGNTTASIGDYFHGSGWDTSGSPGNTTFELSYPFSWDTGSEDEDEIEFISIDDGINGTTVSSATPTFNWTMASDASQYWLQIANDSAFTDLVVNITDINEYTYPSEYDSNTTRVSFTLPVANSLQVIDKTYYCRVQSNTK